jgi:hypothetical protein
MGVWLMSFVETIDTVAVWIGYFVAVGIGATFLSAIILYFSALFIERYLKNYDLIKEFLLWYKEKLRKESDIES